MRKPFSYRQCLRAGLCSPQTSEHVTPLHRHDSLAASALLPTVAGPAMGESPGRVPGVKGNLFGD